MAAPAHHPQKQHFNTNIMPLKLNGKTKASTDPSVISFAHELAPAKWLSIPADLVADTEPVASQPSAYPGESQVRITLKEPVSAEGKFLHALVTILGESLVTLSIKVGPALQADRTDADPACVRCLAQCELIVLSADDPFARIICMLNCPTCPG